MRKWRSISALVCMTILMGISVAFAAAPLTQGDFAMLLVRAMGLEGLVTGPDGTVIPSPTVEDYCRFLASPPFYLEPVGGWDPDAPLTWKIVEEVLLIDTGRTGIPTLDELLRFLEQYVETIPTFVPTTYPVSGGALAE